MKKSLIVILALFSLNTFATSYCYDYATFKLDKLEELIVECSNENFRTNAQEFEGVIGYNVSPIRKMTKRLMGWNPIGYKKRNMNALRSLESYIEKTATVTDLNCMKGIVLYFEKVVKKEVNQAIKYCSL